MPDRDIIDPHHHLWPPEFMDGLVGQYLLEDLHGDTSTVPGVRQTVFVECGAAYRTDGPEHLRSVGETEFVAALAAASENTDGATIAGIVAHTDLTLPPEQLDEALDAHEAAAGGRLRGIRDALAAAPPDTPLVIPATAAPGRAADPGFRRGVARLGERGLTYDTWQYHVQAGEFVDLARAVPGTTMVLDHFCTPLGVGPFAGRRDEIFATWKDDLAAIAACDNVVAKLGGLAMPDNGFGWHEDPERRPDVDAFLAEQARWYHHAIECFGPERCMFESNFPVDKLSVDYAVVWAAFEVIAERYTPAEQDALFAGTARRTYRL
ncbi:MAG: amidohydrolase family protein [Acidimicrobiales bacterium]